MSNKFLLIIFLLVLVAFIGGSQWANFETSRKNGAQEQPLPPKEGEQPQEPPQVLGVQDQMSLTEGVLMSKGNPEAKVTIVEFSEFQCPFCAQYATDTYKKIWEKYGERIFYIWRDFPLPFHQNAKLAAQAAACAGNQGKFWQMHDELFANQAAWSELPDPKANFVASAQKLGLNEEDFSSCYEDNEEISARIEADIELGKRLGVSGTPTFFINGQRLVGAQPYEVFEGTIEQLLAQ